MENSGREMNKLLADPQHRPAQVVGPHDQFRRGLDLVRNPRQHVAAAHDVFLFFRSRIIGEQNTDVYFAEQVLRFADVKTARIRLDECGQRRACFGQFAVAPEFLRSLEFRQADIRRWHSRGGRFALGAHHQFRAE